MAELRIIHGFHAVTARIRQHAGDATFQPLTTPTALQARAFELLGVWPDTGSRYSLDLPSFQPDTTSCPVELRA